MDRIIWITIVVISRCTSIETAEDVLCWTFLGEESGSVGYTM